MITISTGGIGPMDIMANTKAKNTSKEEEKAVDAFASLMNMVSTKQEQADVAPAKELDVADVTLEKSVSNDYEAYSKQEEVNASKDKLQNTEKTVAKEDTQTNDFKETDVDSDGKENIDKAIALVKDVKNALKEALGITDEEFENILADMGIDVTQILTGNNLKNLILQAMGAENVDMLVNEKLANLVSDITNTITELVGDYSFSDVAAAGEFITANADDLELSLKNFDENVDIMVDDNTIVTDERLVAETKAKVETESEAEVENEANEDANLHNVKNTTDNKSENQIGDDSLNDKITVENKAGDNGQATKGQTGEQNSQQVLTNFNQALDNTVNANVNIEATAFTSNVQEADIIRQIIDQIKVTATNEVQSMEVQLNPENLGKVYVNVEAKDGVMQAKIIAETEAAKNAIENNLAVLKENFSNNEIKVEAIEVMVAAYGFFEESQNGDFNNQEQANDTSKSIGGINVNDLGDEELTQEEELEVEIMKSKGNTVSYTV